MHVSDFFESEASSHGSPYDRGGADYHYRRGYNPHKMADGEHVKLTDPAEIAEYKRGYLDAKQGGGGKMYRESQDGVDTDAILQYLSDAYYLIIDNRRSYSEDDISEIERIYGMLRKPLMKGDYEDYSETYSYVLGEYPDASSELIGEMFVAAGLDEQSTIEDFLAKVTNKVSEGVNLKFHTIELSESQIQPYVKKYFECYNINQPHVRFVSNIKKFGSKKLNESAEAQEIIPFIQMISSLDTVKKIKIGDYFSVLAFEIVFAWKEISASGFTTPKEVVDIKMHSDGTISYIKFSDGDRYPRLNPATYQGKPIVQTAYFNSQAKAESALTALALKVPDSWDLDIGSVERGIQEATNWAKEKAMANRERMRREREAARASMPAKPARAPAAPKLSLETVANWIGDATGRAIPDVDPIEYLMPKFAKAGITDPEKRSQLLDRAARKFLGAKDYYDYLADQWDSYNSIADDEYKRDNPWKESVAEMFPSPAVVIPDAPKELTPDQQKKFDRGVKLLDKYREKGLSLSSALTRLNKFKEKHRTDEQGVAEGSYDPKKKFGVRYKVFAGREGRLTTKEYWTTSHEKLEKAVAKIEALDNFYEIDGYSYPHEQQGVAEMDSQQPTGRIKPDGTRSHSTYGSRDHYSLGDPEITLGPDSIIPAKDVAKHLSKELDKELDKAFGKSYKKGVDAQKTFKVVYYSPKTDRNVTKIMKAANKTEIWNKLENKGIKVVSVSEKGVAEGFSYDVDHMPGPTRSLIDINKTSSYTVATNPKGGTKEQRVKVTATSQNDAKNKATEHFIKQGLKPRIDFDGVRVVKSDVIEAHLDPSGLIAAAEMVRDYIVTAEVDGRVKKFRVRGMTGPRAAKERFLKHHSQAKVVDVKPEQGVAEGVKKGLYYNVNKRKKAGTSRPKGHPLAPSEQDWKDAAKTAKKESVREEWSKKYKDSINCARPKGFSQKAHCAGRKKNESAAPTAEYTVTMDGQALSKHGDKQEAGQYVDYLKAKNPGATIKISTRPNVIPQSVEYVVSLNGQGLSKHGDKQEAGQYVDFLKSKDPTANVKITARSVVAEDLDVAAMHVGDPVIITGRVKYKGATGEFVDSSPSGKFVVVNLYNHGKHAFHASDVAYNEYADSDQEEADLYDREPSAFDDQEPSAFDDQERTLGERIYYPVKATTEADLREGFGMKKDSKGWYLEESSGRKLHMQAFRAFGSPTLLKESLSSKKPRKVKEWDQAAYPGDAATIGDDNFVSPVGSVPKNQRK